LRIDGLIAGRDEMIRRCQVALEEGSLEKRVRSSSPNLSLNSRKQASHRVSWRKADHVWLNRMENPLAQKRKSSLPIHPTGCATSCTFGSRSFTGSFNPRACDWQGIRKSSAFFKQEREARLLSSQIPEE